MHIGAGLKKYGHVVGWEANKFGPLWTGEPNKVTLFWLKGLHITYIGGQ